MFVANVRDILGAETFDRLAADEVFTVFFFRISNKAIGCVFVKLALRAVIRLVRNDHRLKGVFKLIAKSILVPRSRNLDLVPLFFVGFRHFPQQRAVCQRGHKSVDGVMAVVGAIFHAGELQVASRCCEVGVALLHG